MATDNDINWTSPGSYSYKRIRIAEAHEIERTYPLLAAYVQDPSLALSINEMIVDPASKPLPWLLSSPRESESADVGEPPVTVSQESHAAIEDHVRSLGLGNGTTDVMIDALRWKRVNRLGSRQQMPACDDAFRRHNGQFADTATVLLLSLAQHIRTLHMADLERYPGDDIIRDYLLHNNHHLLPTPALQELETMHYINDPNNRWDGYWYGDLDFLTHLRCFHRLPALQTFTMDAVHEHQRVTREFYPPRTASFTNLSITRVDLSSSILAAMIRLPRALETLTLSTGGHGDGSMAVFGKTLGKALREHMETLRVLDLDLGDEIYLMDPESESFPEEVYDDDYAEDEFGELPPKDDDEYLGMYQRSLMDEWYFRDLADSTGPRWPHQLPDGDYGPFGAGIGSLKGFTALRHLSIDPHTLLGWARPVILEKPDPGTYPYQQWVINPPFRLINVLPPGLEVLRLYDYVAGREMELDSHVEELMRLRAEKLPNLRVVEGVDEVIEKLAERELDRVEKELLERERQPKPEAHWVRDEL